MTEKTEKKSTERTESPLNKYLTLDEVAEFFGVSRSVVDRWHDRHGLPVVRLGKGHHYVHEDVLDTWMRARHEERPAEG